MSYWKDNREIPPRRLHTPNDQFNQLKEILLNLPVSSEVEPRGISLTVGALRTNITGDKEGKEENYDFARRAVTLIEKTLQENGPLDVLVSPEYFLYNHPRISGGIEFYNDDDHFMIKNGQSEIVIAINRIQELAKEYTTNIVLGTVCESVNLQNDSYFANSLLVINSRGDIQHIRRKTEGSHAILIKNGDEYVWHSTEQIQDDYKPSDVASVVLTSRNNEKFRVLPLICSERSSDMFWKSVAGENADVITGSIREGDDSLTERFRKMSNGYDLDNYHEIYHEWVLGLRLLIASKIHAVRQTGIFVGSDGEGVGSSGIFPLHSLKQMTEFTELEDVLVGTCVI